MEMGKKKSDTAGSQIEEMEFPEAATTVLINQ